MQDYLYRYLPVGLTCVAMVLQFNLFVTPEKLEVKHREILSDIATTYATKEQYNDLKEQLNIVQVKLDKIMTLLAKKEADYGFN
ncbi:MAG: hypothetical protein MJ231_05090 [bacterium]|nr:hypothetical protein [bacterium]